MLDGVMLIRRVPRNWWLVRRHLKHGMMTVRTPNESVIDGGRNGISVKQRPRLDDRFLVTGIRAWALERRSFWRLTGACAHPNWLARRVSRAAIAGQVRN